MDSFIDIFLHIDQHLVALVQNYRAWTYVLLFMIIFCETGLVFFPFLPGKRGYAAADWQEKAR